MDSDVLIKANSCVSLVAAQRFTYDPTGLRVATEVQVVTRTFELAPPSTTPHYTEILLQRPRQASALIILDAQYRSHVQQRPRRQVPEGEARR